MKVFFLALLVAVTCSTGALAQKGMSGLGANLPLVLGDGTTSAGIGLKYHYNFSDYFRMELSGEHMAFHSGGDDEYDYPIVTAFLNGHVFLSSPRPSRPYVIAGLGYVDYKVRHRNDTWFDEESGIISDVGLGYDFRLNHSLSMQIEATAICCLIGWKYNYRDNRNVYHEETHQGQWFFSACVGLAYNF